MSENIQERTFQDFLDMLDETKFQIHIMADMYNKYLGKSLTPAQFLDLPEVKENFEIIRVVVPPVLYLTTIKKKSK